MRKYKHVTVWLLASVITLFLSFPVLAAGEQVINYNQTHIAKNQTVENVVVIGNDSVIEGNVRDAVIIVNGDLTVKPTAQIDGVVVVLGGGVEVEQGAMMTDNVLNLSFQKEIINNLILGISIVAGLWILKFGFSLLLIFVFVLTVFLAKKRLDSIEQQITASPKRLLLVGISTSIFLVALSILLTITVVGIPVVLIMLTLALLFFILSLASMSKIVGDYLLRSSGKNWKSPFVGAIALVAGLNFPFFGVILFLVLLWISLGVMTMWVSNWLKQKRKNSKSGTNE